MKDFGIYQYIPGTQMTDRDKVEVGSRFWNEGKYETYVRPFIAESPVQRTFIDMGCNSGLFLKMAEVSGFGACIGVDSDARAIEKGERFRDQEGLKYRFIEKPMESVIDELPLADYTVFANAHYYMTVNDWLDYLDKALFKSRYVIIITAEKRHLNRCWASADIGDIRYYFRQWEEVGFIDALPNEGDPSYRALWGLCFKSPYLERIDINLLDSGNHVQDQFYAELDEGKDFSQTRYYRIIEKYRRGKWSPERLENWFKGRVSLYNDVKENGLKRPIYADKTNLILDGNHRYSMMKHLGNDTVIVRRT